MRRWPQLLQSERMEGMTLPDIVGIARPVGSSVTCTASIAAGRARHCISGDYPSHLGLLFKTERSRCYSNLSPRRVSSINIMSRERSSHLSEAKSEPHVQEEGGLKQLLDRIRAGVGFHSIPWSTDQTYEITGSHELWTLSGPWQFLWSTSGLFFERIHSSKTFAVWAYDGSRVWTSDSSGHCTQADMDDAEVAILSSWIRSSYWLSDRGQEQLTLTLLSPSQLRSIRDFKGHPSDLVIRIRLKNGKVGACVVVQQGMWVPHVIWMEAYGTVESWELNQWQPLLAGKEIQFPAEIIRNCAAGGRQVHWVNASSAWKESSANDAPAWQIPPNRWLQSPLATYPVTTVDPHPPVYVEATLAPGGHLLVRPLIDGQDVGFFLLDSGATGLVLLRPVAERLGMRSYGEVVVIGVNGPSASSFCEGESLEWGPLKISHPSYVLIPDLNLGNDLPPLAGILGSDVFQHCVVEIDFRQPSVKVMCVDQYVPSTSVPPVWQEVKFMSALPHIPAVVRKGRTGGSPVLVLLDTGAAGVDAIFHSRATEQMGLSGVKTQGSTRLGGPGSDTTMQEVGVSTEVSVEVGGLSFENINAIFMPPSTVGGVDLSEWSAGLICSTLFRNCVCIFDYSNRRVSLHRYTR